VGFVLGLIVVAVLIGALIHVMGSGDDRYANMTDEEFEEEARRKSFLGAAITGLEGTLRKREATVLMEAKTRVERDATPSPGDPPDDEGSTAPKS